MNWEAIGTIAEVVGALGVIVSLLYLAVQVRQGNRNHAVDSAQQISRDFTHYAAIVMRNENVGAFIKGLNSYSDLTPEERLKFDHCLGTLINVAESTIYHVGAGRLEEMLEMLSNYTGPRIFSYSGFEEWWNHGKKAGFAALSQEWVDGQIERYRGSPTFWEHNKAGR